MGLLNDVIKMPYGLLGVSANQYDGLSVVHKNGYNSNITNSSVPETVWNNDGLYPWSAFNTASTLSLESTSASDTGSITIDGLDDNYYPFKETITLTGTTAVTTARQFKRVQNITYADDAVGTITASIGDDVVGQVDPGQNRSLMAIYTVPAGYDAYVLTGDASVNKGHDAQIEFYGRPFGQSFMIQHMAEIYENSYRYDFTAPLRMTEKTDLDVRVSSVENSGTRVTANFDLLLVRK